MMATSASRRRDALTALPIFISPQLLDVHPQPPPPRYPADDVPPSSIAELYSLQHTLPEPISLHSYLHAVLQRIDLFASSSLSFSPSATSSAFHRFADEICGRLWHEHADRRSLAVFLLPLMDCVQFSWAASAAPLAAEWREEFAVAYTGAIVSRALVDRTDKDQLGSADTGNASSSTSVPRAGEEVRQWLEAMQRLLLSSSFDGCPDFRFSERLLLSPLHRLQHPTSSPADPSLNADQLCTLCLTVADGLLSCSPSAQSPGVPTCPTAFEHCTQRVVSRWLFHACTPPHLLPTTSPFPSPIAAPIVLAALTKALPAHVVLVVLADVVLMVHGETSTFPCDYVTLPTCSIPSSSSTSQSSGSVPVGTCQRLHAALCASGCSVSALLDRLLLQDGSASASAHVVVGRVAPTVAYLSSMLVSGLSTMYSAGLQTYLFHHMSSGTDLAVPLLSALSFALYSPRVPLFEPTVSACRRWKDGRDRAPSAAADDDASTIEQRLLQLVVTMAHTHRTITALLGVTAPPPSEAVSSSSSPSPSSSSPALFPFTRCTAHDSWLAVVSFYSSSPAHCMHSLLGYCRSSRAHRVAWSDFLRFSLNSQLFQSFLAASSDLLRPPASCSPVPTPFHVLSFVLNDCVQRGLPGAEVIGACLEPLPSSISSLLVGSSTTSVYVPGAPLRSALSSYLHHWPTTGAARGPMLGFAPPHLLALCSAVLEYLSMLSSPFSSCYTIISALSSFAPVLSPSIVAASINRWLKANCLPSLSSSEEARRRSASKGLMLALLLCDELKVDLDQVWDAELSERLIIELTRYAARVRTVHRKASSTRLPPLPPLLSFVDDLLALPSLARQWVPQVVRPTAPSSSSSPPPPPSLLRSSKVVQLLTVALLGPTDSPFHPRAEDESDGVPAWQTRLRSWRERLTEIQQTMRVEKACLCEDGELVLTSGTSTARPPSTSADASPEHQHPLPCCHRIHLNSCVHAGAAHMADDKSTTNSSGMSATGDAPLLSLRGALAHSAQRVCSHDSGVGTSSCASVAVPPYCRWLRWVTTSSFASPMPAERVYGFIVAHYPDAPVERLLSDSFSVAVRSVDRRRRADLCPFLSPDLPPLIDRLLTAHQHSAAFTSNAAPWLLATLVDLLETEVKRSSIADVLRALPRLYVVLLPPSSLLPVASFHRLLSLLRGHPFLVPWVLQGVAVYWQQQEGSEPSRAALLDGLLLPRFGDLCWPQTHIAVEALLREDHAAFVRELQRLSQSAAVSAQSSLALAPYTEEEAPTADALDEQLHLSFALHEDADGRWHEIDWARACDDDTNLALLHKMERDRKGSRRAAAVPRPPGEQRPAVQPPSDVAVQRGNSEPVARCEAQTQTDSSALSLSPSTLPDSDGGRYAGDFPTAFDLSSLLFPPAAVSSSSSSPPAGDERDDVAVQQSTEDDRGVWEDPFALSECAAASLTGFLLPMDSSAPPPALPPPFPPSPFPLQASSPRSSVAASPRPLPHLATFTPLPRLYPTTHPSLLRPESRPPSSPAPQSTGFTSAPNEGFAHLRSAITAVRRTAGNGHPVGLVSAPPNGHSTEVPWMKNRMEHQQVQQQNQDDDSAKRRRLL